MSAETPRWVAVTGTSGFLGRHVMAALARRGHEGRAVTRAEFDLATPSAGAPDLSGVDALIHCAARVHRTGDDNAGEEARHQTENYRASLHLIDRAVADGLRHVVLISTAAVYGVSAADTQITENTPLDPRTPYARAKLAAEAALSARAEAAGMGFTILRLPILLGPGAPGNLGALARLVACGLPLPFGAAHNRRTMLRVENAADLAAHALQAPALNGQTLLVSDGNVLSTRVLLQQMAGEAGRPSARLLSVPAPLMRGALRALGKGKMADQLFGDLVFVPSPAIAASGWQPVVPVFA